MTGDRVRARKNHICSLCYKTIHKDEEYVRQRIAPWECISDMDPRFWTFKAHLSCLAIWDEVKRLCDYMLPDGPMEWQETVEYWEQRHLEVAK